MSRLSRYSLAAVFAATLGTFGCDMNRTGESGLVLRWGVVDNHLDDGFLSRMVLSNQGEATLDGDWTLYFNFLRVIDEETVTPPLTVDHVNGDLYALRPSVGPLSLAPGDSVAFEFMSAAWAVSVTDGPAGAYLVRAGESEEREIRIVPIGIEPFRFERQTDRGKSDHRPVTTAAIEFDRNSALRRLEAGDVVRVTPTPRLIARADGEVELRDGLSIQAEKGLEAEGEMLAARLSEWFGVNATVAASDGNAVVHLALADQPADSGESESYSLLADPTSGIEITGTDPAGVFYGIQSLLSAVAPEHMGTGRAIVPALRVEDAPRFGYRGMHLDVARNFQTKDAVLKLLDLMGFYKLNRFHFHLTDDEGWRLQIGGLPELTAVGGFRGHTTTESDHLIPSYGSGPYLEPAVSHGSGYYTRDEFIEILRFAAARHIEVIPEIDVPGHARAAIVAMRARRARLASEAKEEEARRFMLTHPEDSSRYVSVQHWNDNVVDVCLESTYAFLGHVVDEIVDMYSEAGAPLTTIHTGGDEVPRGVWTGSPACQDLRAEKGQLDLPSYFLDRFGDILSERGLITAGWEEIALRRDESGNHGAKEPDLARLDRGVRPYVWNSIWGSGSEELAYRLANAGFDVVLSSASNLYFDLAYDKHPDEPGYYWAGYVDTRKPYELEPFDLYRCAREDLMGNPIDQVRYQRAERLTAAGRSRILGIQGQLWGENAKGEELMDYLAFPKLIGLAERAWAAQPAWSEEESMEAREDGLEAAWNEFANRLGARELPRLDRVFDGVDYRIPPPGAIVEDRILSANVAFPGLEIRFTTDGSVPNTTSQLYEAQTEVVDAVLLRTFDSRGRGSRTTRADVRQ